MITIDCHDNDLRGLKDPYTGRELKFKMLLGFGSPRVYAPDAFSPNKVHPTSQEAFEAVHMRDGIRGAVGEHEVVKCPYLGTSMMLVKVQGGYSWIGGFDPTLPIYAVDTFINNIRTRDGHLNGRPRGTPPAAFIKEKDTDLPTDVDVSVPEPNANTEDLLRKVIDGPGKTKKTVVSVNGRGRRGRGKRDGSVQE